MFLILATDQQKLQTTKNNNYEKNNLLHVKIIKYFIHDKFLMYSFYKLETSFFFKKILHA